MSQPKVGDLKTGLMGVVIGAVLLFAAMTFIVHLTNAHYAGEKPAAEATK
jgi:hypothetical protein